MSGTPARILLALLVIAGVGLAIFLVSNRGYGKVSQSAYDLAKAAYSAALARSPERITAVEALLNEEATQEGMTEQEIGWLKDILQNARDGDWDDAAEAARQIMEDQVEH